MRFTEAMHPQTVQLDTLTAKQLVECLQNIELEVFANTWGNGLGDACFQSDLSQLQAHITHTLNQPKGVVIIAGAGTSGRLALHAEKTIDRSKFPGRVAACLAGGEPAFLKAKEGVEDSSVTGMADLKVQGSGKGPRVFLGITCGLSAAYVAGALHEAMSSAYSACAILGFNPIEEASQRLLPDVNGSFRDLLFRLQEEPNGYLLNPILGPEPLTGSTRLKGGTATKIILDLLLSQVPIATGMQYYQNVLASARGLDTGLDEHVTRAGDALNQGGSLIYLTHGRAGLMALLDASECPPTFGANPSQVRAFIGHPISKAFANMAMDQQLWAAYAKQAKGTDAVFWIEERAAMPAPFQALISQKNALPFSHSERTRNLLSSAPATLQEGLLDLLIKRQLNTLSTAAFVLAGKVWGNRMIDLGISNRKLFQRACRIIAQIGNVDEKDAKTALIATILHGSAIGCVSSQEALIAAALKRPKLVPLTLLCLVAGLNQDEAEKMLERYPKVKIGLKLAMEKS